MVLSSMTLLIPAFALVFAPPVLPVRLLRYSTTLPYQRPSKKAFQSFGTMLEPRYVVGARALDQ